MSEEESPQTEPEENSAENDEVGSSDTAAEATDSSDENQAANNSANSSEETPDLEPEAESRNNARVNLDRPMLIRLSNGDTVKARMVNLSCGGLAFEYPAPAESGVTFGILFQLASDADTINIQAEGIARHSHVKSESFVTGIQFTKISEEHVDIIEEFVEYKLSSTAQLTGFAVSHRHRG